MLWLELPMYAALGAVAGFFAGLLGIGGGAIIGPVLILIYTGLLQFPAEHAAHMAVATATGVIVVTAPISAATHARQKNIDWQLTRLISVGVVVGALFGAHAAALAPAKVLKFLLMMFLFSTMVNMLLSRRPIEGDQRAALSGVELLPVSCVIGALSAVLGIGGGALTVPYLNRRGVRIKRAIGCSAFVGFPLALAAAMGYVVVGADIEGLPPGTVGYIYLPALVCIAAFSMVAAFLGARMTSKLPSLLLKRVFALITGLIALRLLILIVYQ